MQEKEEGARKSDDVYYIGGKDARCCTLSILYCGRRERNGSWKNERIFLFVIVGATDGRDACSPTLSSSPHHRVIPHTNRTTEAGS